jgi:predicted transcriptional regulator
MQSSRLAEQKQEKILYITNHADGELSDKILTVLADRYSRKILDATRTAPKSASDLASNTDIPISTVYRRLQNLLDAKLLDISGMISNDGKKYFLYKNSIKEIRSKMIGTATDITIVFEVSQSADPEV